MAANACPKCGAPVTASAAECLRCGVIFARLRAAAPPAPAAAPALESPSPATEPGRLALVWEGWLESDAGAGGAAGAGLAALLLALLGLPYFVLDMGDQRAPSFLHAILSRADLVFHEAGHVIFGVLGDFIGVLGGSLMQVLIPSLCLVSFLFFQKSALGAAVALWWIGVNLVEVGQYAYDARSQTLVLLGGVTGAEAPGYHDWNNLLGRTGLLSLDHALGRTLQVGGCALIALGAAGCALLAVRRWRAAREARADPRAG